MRWSWLFLSLLFISTGCRHADIPKLPASHGHLSFAMERLLAKKDTPPGPLWEESLRNEATSLLDTSTLEVEPEQAPAVFAEVVQLLRGTPSEEELTRALSDLRAVCDAGFHEACEFMRKELGNPKKISGGRYHFTKEMIEQQKFAFMVFRCRINTEGWVRDCTIVEGDGMDGAEQNLAVLFRSRFSPATLAGHPMSIPYTFSVRFRPAPAWDGLSRAEVLAWARLRVSQYPQSTLAWGNLALELADQAPEDPLYPQAVARAHALAPKAWWPATELAWQRVQAGQYAAAMMVVRTPMRRERENPYVLETGAAAHFGLGQCAEALKLQERAVGLLPEEWPAPERERFQRKLKDYQAACAAPAVSAAPDPR
ncbi:hypothetical protein [Corallococcus sicarius]|uniref:TonB C-terminal domain-containing protein n=1 Tax=Corallococcus sicarius TaxID=2316726 RepID=A0A3A8N4L7_9BACT|nr:hypothetical protein [Corallococcus sicarius]RKH38873.1 hypothetical protein D7X12_25090 [Corallococcus sicarius]